MMTSPLWHIALHADPDRPLCRAWSEPSQDTERSPLAPRLAYVCPECLHRHTRLLSPPNVLYIREMLSPVLHLAELKSEFEVHVSGVVYARTTEMEEAAIGQFRGGHGQADTSRKAAVSVYHVTGPQRVRVLDWFMKHGRGTDDQVAAGLEMSPNSERPRRIELVEAGLVRDSGDKTKTTSGRACVIWEISPKVRWG